MKFIRIPCGENFTRILCTSEDSRLQAVQVSRPFWLGQFPVTQLQYQTIMGMNPSFYQGKKVGGVDSADFPVDQVSWADAIEFCHRLGNRPEERDALASYRLPTEEEWKFACCSVATPESFGSSEGEMETGSSGNSGSNSPVPSVWEMMPKKWGCYGLYGNIGEWCSDDCQAPRVDLEEVIGLGLSTDCWNAADEFAREFQQRFERKVYMGQGRSVAGYCCFSSGMPKRSRMSEIGFRVVFVPAG